MAVVCAYFDDSRAAGIVAVGGYLSTSEAWDTQFAPAWDEMLADPIWPGGRVHEFKASDCRNGAGEFSKANGWTKADRHRLMVRAAKVITTATPSHNTVGLGAAIELPPTRTHESLLKYERFAFYMCFEQVIQNALRITRSHLKRANDKVQFIFDEQPGYHGMAYEQFEKARLMVTVGRRHQVPPPMFASSEDVTPLQAADLLAHETFKEVKNLRQGRKFSGALRALVTGRVHHADFVDARAFRAIEQATKDNTAHGIPAPNLSGIGRLYDSYQPIRGDE